MRCFPFRERKSRLPRIFTGQARLLRKYTEKVIISYDSDGAGQAATMRGLEILKNVGCDVRILQMEGAKDPDEYVIKYGNGRFNMLVDNAISLVEFKTKVLKKSLDLNNVSDKIKFLKETARLLTTVDSKIEQELYIDRISSEYGISKEALYAEINKTTKKNISIKTLEKKPRPVIKKEDVDKKLIKRTKHNKEDKIQPKGLPHILAAVPVCNFTSDIRSHHGLSGERKPYARQHNASYRYDKLSFIHCNNVW